MKEISLTRGAVAYCDDGDWEMLMTYAWSLQSRGYAQTGVSAGKYRRRTILMHRLLLSEPNGRIDHINRNKLDNRRANLRIASPGKNLINSKFTRARSGVRGVYWHRKASKWAAQIGVDYKTLHLGLFRTLDEALLARQQAEVHYFGELCSR